MRKEGRNDWKITWPLKMHPFHYHLIVGFPSDFSSWSHMHLLFCSVTYSYGTLLLFHWEVWYWCLHLISAICITLQSIPSNPPSLRVNMHVLLSIYSKSLANVYWKYFQLDVMIFQQYFFLSFGATKFLFCLVALHFVFLFVDGLYCIALLILSLIFFSGCQIALLMMRVRVKVEAALMVMVLKSRQKLEGIKTLCWKLVLFEVFLSVIVLIYQVYMLWLMWF